MQEENKKAAKILWDEIIDYLTKELDSVVIIDVWFKPLEPLTIEDNTLYLSSLTQSNVDFINDYMPSIKKALISLNSTVTGINIVVENSSQKEEKIVHIVDNSVEEKSSSKQSSPMFNLKYTFDNFVVGSSNQFVYTAATEVAKNPGIKFNPLFIYGGVGLGKTHLIQAIGNSILSQNPNCNIMYVTSDKFTNDFIESIHSGYSAKDEGFNSSFRQKYRTADVLMVDDIQFIKKNAERTQEELFHTFNDLYNSNKQIIITSDRSPKELVSIVDRLKSRFEWGLIADIKPPDKETKIAILKKKAELQKCNLSYEILNLIADKSSANVREMEGLLTRVIFYASLNNSMVTTELANEALKDITDTKKEVLNIDNIIDLVCNFYNISSGDLLGKKRNKEIVEPRQICIYLITEFLSLPLGAIAEKFNRDHTTVIHARDKISEKIVSDERLSTQVSDLKALINKK